LKDVDSSDYTPIQNFKYNSSSKRASDKKNLENIPTSNVQTRQLFPEKPKKIAGGLS
jgi:hypothetical protein